MGSVSDSRNAVADTRHRVVIDRREDHRDPALGVPGGSLRWLRHETVIHFLGRGYQRQA